MPRVYAGGAVRLAAARTRLAEGWDEIDFDERRELPREVVVVTVTNDGVRVQIAG